MLSIWIKNFDYLCLLFLWFFILGSLSILCFDFLFLWTASTCVSKESVFGNIFARSVYFLCIFVMWSQRIFLSANVSSQKSHMNLLSVPCLNEIFGHMCSSWWILQKVDLITGKVLYWLRCVLYHWGYSFIHQVCSFVTCINYEIFNMFYTVIIIYF